MNVHEEALLFASRAGALAGVLAIPEAPRRTGMVIVVGGPQYRAGSHRQFVLLARAIAGEGFPVLRFDYRGMGDSPGERADFCDAPPDIAAAVALLHDRLPGVEQVALWGLCDGASAALMSLEDRAIPRIAGLCLANPWVRSEASLARTHVKHYYRERLRQKAFWLKLLRGDGMLRAAAGLWRNLLAMTGRGQDTPDGGLLMFQARMARSWSTFPGRILLLLSGQDFTAKEFLEYAAREPAWAGLLQRATVTRQDFPDADHTFSNRQWRGEVEAATVRWLLALDQR